jgi:RNA recognition motif-containing protein
MLCVIGDEGPSRRGPSALRSPREPVGGAFGEDTHMGKTLVILGLPESLTEENLYDLFDLYGCIEDVRVWIDELTQTSLGQGEVTFRSENCAHDALEAVDGLEILGARLTVRPALDGDHVPNGSGDLEFVAEISRPLWDRTRSPAVS